MKKAKAIKREIEEVSLESVSLKHHEFEKRPQDEQVCPFASILISYFKNAFFNRMS